MRLRTRSMGIAAGMMLWSAVSAVSVPAMVHEQSTVAQEAQGTGISGSTQAEVSEYQDITGTGTVNGLVPNYLHLRIYGGLDQDITGHLLPGDEVKVTGQEGDWYRITVPEKNGYVFKDFLTVTENEAVTDAEEQTVAALQEDMAQEIAGGLNEEQIDLIIDMIGEKIDEKYSQNGQGSSTEEGCGALTPEGNMSIIDDYGPVSGSGQQFITLTTKKGNVFYLVIDRSSNTENVHFLNLVDEADLLSLMDEDEADEWKQQETVPETTEETTQAPKTESETQPETQPEKKQTSAAPLIISVLAVLAGAGAFYVYKKKTEAAEKSKTEDPDADYKDEGYYSQDEEDGGEEDAAYDENEEYDENGDE